MMCYNQKRKERMFWWLADRKVSVKRKIELRIRRAPSNASALSRDSKWPGIRYWEYLQICRCFWYLMSGFFVFCVSIFQNYWFLNRKRVTNRGEKKNQKSKIQNFRAPLRDTNGKYCNQYSKTQVYLLSSLCQKPLLPKDTTQQDYPYAEVNKDLFHILNGYSNHWTSPVKTDNRKKRPPMVE